MKHLLLILITFLLIACSKEIEIDLPKSNPKLVINSLFSPDSLWSVQISRSTAPDWDSAYTPIVADAKVDLWENDIHLGTMSYIGKGKYTLPLYPKVGKKYTVRASAPNFGEVAEATDSIPTFPDSFTANLDTNTVRNYVDIYNGNALMNPLNIFLKDNPNEQNYYRFQAIYYDSCICNVNSVNGINSLYNDTYRFNALNEDPYTEKLNPNIRDFYANDTYFNGNEHIFTFYIATGDRDKFIHYSTGYTINAVTGEVMGDYDVYVELYADIYSLSKAYYDFSLSYYKQSYNTADPNATYNNAYSNVKGGYGLFAGYQKRRVLLYHN